MKDYEILGAIWYTPPVVGALFDALVNIESPAVGVVAIKSGPKPENWKCYLGFAESNTNSQQGEQSVAANGVKVSKPVACAHFPHLPADKFVF